MYDVGCVLVIYGLYYVEVHTLYAHFVESALYCPETLLSGSAEHLEQCLPEDVSRSRCLAVLHFYSLPTKILFLPPWAAFGGGLVSCQITAMLLYSFLCCLLLSPGVCSVFYNLWDALSRLVCLLYFQIICDFGKQFLLSHFSYHHLLTTLTLLKRLKGTNIHSTHSYTFI